MKYITTCILSGFLMILISCHEPSQPSKNTPGVVTDYERERPGTVEDAIQLIETKREKEGIEIVNYLLKTPKDSLSYLLYLKAMAFYKLQDYNNAMNIIDRSIEFDNSNYRSYATKGDIFQKRKNLDSAMVYYQKALVGLPNDEFVLNNMGNVYFSKGELESAKRIYYGLSLLTPDDPDHLYNLSYAYYKAKNFDSALTVIDQAIQLRNDDAGLFNLKGQIHGKMKNFKAAEESFNQSLKLKPDENTAAENLRILKSQQ